MSQADPRISIPAGNGHTAVQLIRSATVKLAFGDTVFLVDPLLAEPGAYPGFPGTWRSHLRNPLLPLPLPAAEVVRDVSCVVLTHTHLDHWDEAAQKALPRDMPFIVQDEKDAALVRSQGFADVRILKGQAEFQGVRLVRTACRHGSPAMYADPDLSALLGSVMGVFFEKPGMKSVYLAADTVWFSGVEDALGRHRPDVVVLNTGHAMLADPKFKDDPFIIMGREDVLRTLERAPHAAVVAVHMDAVNHMTLDRRELAEHVREQGLGGRVYVPFDGECIRF